MPLVLVTDATGEPVVSLDVRHWLRLSTSDTAAEDAILDNMIKTARVECENYTRRICMPQTWKYILDDFPSSTEQIILPLAPVSSTVADVTITFIEDASGQSTTLPATCYTVDYYSDPPRVYPTYGNEWPDNVRDIPNAVTIQAIYGYQVAALTSTATTPQPIRDWIKMRVGAAYENRESLSLSNVQNVQLGHDYFMGLLDPYVRPEVY